MNKYQKINIVESKFPPVNKHDWWFDLNKGILKKYVNGEWNKYDTKPRKSIKMPADNEVWLRYTGEFDEDAFYNYVINNMPNLDASWEVKDDVIILTGDNLGNLLAEDIYFSNSFGEAFISSIKLPKVSILGNDYESSIINYDIDWVIMQDVQTIRPYVWSPDIDIICLADTPPVISSYSFGDDAWGKNVYVKDEVVGVYKNDTNWCEFNILPISELDENIYNWG